MFRMKTYLVKAPINNDHGANKVFIVTKLSNSVGLTTGNLDINNNRIYNVAQPNRDNQLATKIWSGNKFLDKSSGVMAGPLNMSKLLILPIQLIIQMVQIKNT